MKSNIFAVAVLLLLLLGPILAPQDANAIDLDNKLKQPDMINLLGTDQLGRDLLSRVLTGGQTTVGISLLSLLIATTVGAGIGLLTGVVGGRFDWCIMRIVDCFMVFPAYLVAIIVSGLLDGGLLKLVIAIAIARWMIYTRLVRSIVLQEKSKDYMLIAKLSGASNFTIIKRHFLPHIVQPILSIAILDLGKIILIVASLSYLGLGVQLPNAEWGAMINDGRTYFFTASRLMLVPGAAIVMTVLLANIIGNKFKFGSHFKGEK